TRRRRREVRRRDLELAARGGRVAARGNGVAAPHILDGDGDGDRLHRLLAGASEGMSRINALTVY
ncbi:unnamed protein product, partial [Urochloa humidicola]